MGAANFGRYKVSEEIGRGAMGVVYRALDPAIGRPVAIKVINEKYLASVGVEAEEYFERFRREAEVAGRLSHRGVVRIYDLGPNYIVMELIEGQSLAALMRGHAKQHLSAVLDIVSQAAAALDYAHAQGIVHRDVKPANIMVEPDGTVRVMDFGLARIDSSTLTAAGEILGSASYMAPELIKGRPATAKSDLFSLGVVAYELLTGERPFGGASISAIVHNIVEKTPRGVHALNLNLPPDYDDIFARVLAKEPTARYRSATAFADALTLKKWPDRDPTITAPLAEASPDALTMIDGTAIQAAARAAAAASALDGPPDATLVMDAASLAESAHDVPATVLLPAVGGHDKAGTPASDPPAPPRPGGFAEPASSPEGPTGKPLLGLALGCGALALVAAFVSAVFLARILLPKPAGTPSPSTAAEPASPPATEGPAAQPALPAKPAASAPKVPASTPTPATAAHPAPAIPRRPAATPTPEPAVQAGDLVPLTEDVAPPRKISGDSPRLPASTSGFKTTTVILEFIVAEDGSVQNLHVVESGGPVLDKACLDVVGRWRYDSATKKGVHVKVVQRASFKFEFR